LCELVISICYFNRNEPVDQVPKTPVPVDAVTQKSPDIVRSSGTNVDCSGGYDDDDDDDDDECGDDGHQPDFEKDDMLARRTGSYQKPNAGAGQAFNVFLPKPGSVKHKTIPVSGSQSFLKTREQETAPSLDRLGPPGNEVFVYECKECCICGARAKEKWLHFHSIINRFFRCGFELAVLIFRVQKRDVLSNNDFWWLLSVY